MKARAALEVKAAPHNPLGAKGAGEGGIIPVGGVIANAVADALSSLGVEPRDLPLSPPKLWELIAQARQARPLGRFEGVEQIARDPWIGLVHGPPHRDHMHDGKYPGPGEIALLLLAEIRKQAAHAGRSLHETLRRAGRNHGIDLARRQQVAQGPLRSRGDRDALGQIRLHPVAPSRLVHAGQRIERSRTPASCVRKPRT